MTSPETDVDDPIVIARVLPTLPKVRSERLLLYLRKPVFRSALKLVLNGSIVNEPDVLNVIELAALRLSVISLSALEELVTKELAFDPKVIEVPLAASMRMAVPSVES